MTIETRNRQWGFYGTCVTNGHPDPDLAWDMMIRILTDPLGDFRFTSEVARDLLDAPWGRHLADAVAGQSVVRAMSKVQRPQDPQSMTWIVPPECQGQMIELAYGVDEDGQCWERATDRSAEPGHPERVTYRCFGHGVAVADWDPFNRQPQVAR